MDLKIDWYPTQEDLFSDIIYNSDNPVVIKTEKIFKEGDKVKKVLITEKFELTSNDFLSELRKGKTETIEFKQRGFLKLFRKYNLKYLENRLSGIDTSVYNWIIMNSKVRESLIGSKLLFCSGFEGSNLILDDRLGDEIIFGSRLSKCIVNKKTGEYYIDTKEVTILSLV